MGLNISRDIPRPDKTNSAAHDTASDSSPRLSLTLFRTFFLYTFIVVIVMAASLIAISFATYENEARANLVQEAENAASVLNGLDQADQLELLSKQTKDAVRFTLIAPGGEVLFESTDSEHPQESHADRPEVKAALNEGASSVVRFSDTLQTDTIYAAVRLSDGSVIRLSETRGSIFSFIVPMSIPLLIALTAIAGLLALISKALTRKIMRPLEHIDMASPIPEGSYAEMLPTIDRINKQQRQLKEQNVELQRAERIRHDFSANVSHEMKTPLHVISGYAEIMASGNVPSEKMREFASLIYDEAQDMRSLIDDVLTLSRLDEPVNGHQEMAILNLLDVASEAVGRLRHLAEKHDIAITITGNSAFMKGDHVLLSQMTENLISNAIRYNKPGGSVDVQISSQDGRIMLRVSDTGIGIPEEDQEKIFERFYRVDKSRSRETGGTGLGLAIAKHAAAFHHGNLTVKSVLGKGSTFEATFPTELPTESVI